MSDKLKRTRGQFFTISNPFKHDAFFKWSEKWIHNNNTILEPFAGENHIVSMIEDMGFKQSWDCYDIDPSCAQKTSSHKYPVIQQDTIKNFPSGYSVAITNPPYLAKNSATRRKLPYPDTHYDDLYKLSLEIMLNNCEYVAAIIPESFLTQNLFHDRLDTFISLTKKMFDDTDAPVCLALFSPANNKKTHKNFDIWRNNLYIGKYYDIISFKLQCNEDIEIRFNDKQGNLGLHAIDGTQGPSIRFVEGNEINPDKIKISSRSFSRIMLNLPNNISIQEVIDKSNELLEFEREKTFDIFMTSFKGVRKDGLYRRRLSFSDAKRIISCAIYNLKKEK